jgi:CheY-like chemotaxis protein
VLRRTRPDLERPYKAVGYPVLPAIYIGVAGLIEVLLLRYKPEYTWPGLIIVLLGVPVYFLGGIHLLMTDVVMPGMNGRELARKLLHLYPGLKCLFMSGYTANVIAHHGVLDEGVHFIQKPFSLNTLTIQVREVLAEK